MKLKRIYLLLFGLVGLSMFSAVAAQNNVKQPIDYVEPTIGSGGHGHVFVGANVPFGLVQLGPTEQTRGWDWSSGYHSSDSIIVGFGHLHLSGTGIGDLGDIGFLPVSNVTQGSVKFSHDNETVRPGYYSIKLNNPNVFVELAATKHVGFHRYNFGANVPEGLIKIDLKQGIGWDKMTSCNLTQESPTRVTGQRMSEGWAVNQQVYFVAEFSQPVKLVANQDTASVFSFENNGSPLLVKVGVSAVSIDNAKLNLKVEVPGWNFNGVVANANNAWAEQLDKIKITTDDESVKNVFYTAMYHTMIAPSVFSDVNGDYRGSDGKVHHGNFTDYTTFSLWDTYRSAHPLMSIIHTDMLNDIAETFINICKEQGRLPVWHLMGNETNCMVGNPAVAVLADMVLKGWVKDKEAALQAMKATAMFDYRGQQYLREYNYIPFDKDLDYETVSKTLEYALAYSGAAKVAKMMGKNADYKFFYKLSQSYKNLFDKKSLYMRARDSKGNWREPFSPFRSIHERDDYTEGNAWQYTWLVPHDVHGLVGLFPSENAFVTKLDSLFTVSGYMGEDASPDISGLIGLYAQGNEPSHHIMYMYDYVGQPWKGAKLLRQSMTTMYGNRIDGLSGNEDVGAMSAWYILSSMGLYQVDPSGGQFVFGSPILDEAKINVGKGKTFTVVAKNNSADNIYIQSVKLNGKEHTKSYIDYTDIMRGGTLEFTMGSSPSKFGTAKKDRP